MDRIGLMGENGRDASPPGQSGDGPLGGVCLHPWTAAVSEPPPDPFLDACGSTGPLRLVVRGPGASGDEVRSFPRPFAVVGRDGAADLVLDHPEVGRRHAYLQLIAGRLFCADLRSRTGTRWDGGPRTMGWIG